MSYYLQPVLGPVLGPVLTSGRFFGCFDAGCHGMGAHVEKHSLLAHITLGTHTHWPRAHVQHCRIHPATCQEHHLHNLHKDVMLHGTQRSDRHHVESPVCENNAHLPSCTVDAPFPPNPKLPRNVRVFHGIGLRKKRPLLSVAAP